MQRCKLAFTGDVMCGDSFYAVGSGVASSMTKYGRAFLPTELSDILRSHDLVFCNVEAVLSDANRNDLSLRSLHMRGRPEFAKHLAEWGFNVAAVANNHILEHGRECALNTVQSLENAGIEVIGAGRDNLFGGSGNYYSCSVGGVNFAFVSLCTLPEKYAYNGGGDLEKTLGLIKKLSGESYFVIVSLHWGCELMDCPSPKQRLIAAELRNAGAKIIVGHHPHVVQGVKLFDNCVIAYSLGNFIFNGYWPDTTWGIVLSVTIEDGSVSSVSYIPVENDEYHRPTLPENTRKNKFNAEILRRNALLETDISQEQYEQISENLRSGSRKELRRKLIKNMQRMNPVFWPQIMMRFVQRRVGLW